MSDVTDHVLLLVASIVLLAPFELLAQRAMPGPSPIAEASPRHERVARAEAPGRRVELKAVKGAVLFSGPQLLSDKPVPLVIHFHGAPWLIEIHASRHLPRAALITVQLGAGSRVYATPFEDEAIFRAMIDEAARELGLRSGWSTITLTGFSAGYGAIRAILRHGEHFRKVKNVLLLDGIHAAYSPEGKPPAAGGAVDPEDLDSFLRFSREAAAGRKAFVITHSEIIPGTYASTTECTEVLIRSLGLKRRPQEKQGPMGMQQLSTARSEGFRVFGYAGDSAPDHVDHLHAMPAWFRYLTIK